jgi:hypothetical protein
MSDFLISLFIAAGVAAFVYSRMGPRLGYGNTKTLWILVSISFVFVFLFLITLLKYVLNIS